MARGRVRGRSAGVTLVEAAIVLVILAVVLVFGVTAMGPLIAGRDRLATEVTLDSIRDALVGYANINSRLPRVDSSGSDGVEDAATNNTTSRFATPSTNYLPNATIGCARGDAYGRAVEYDVDNDYTNVQNGSGTTQQDLWDELDGTGQGTATDDFTAGPRVKIDSTTEFSVAFVVVSLGPDGQMDAATGRLYQVYETSAPPAGYDDIVIYMTAAELYEKTGGP